MSNISSKKSGQAQPVASPMELAMSKLEDHFGKECPRYNRATHKEEVDSGDTRLWNYWEWLVHQIEADESTVDRFIEEGSLPRYVACSSWGHIFIDSREENTRWIYDKLTDKLVAAQVQNRTGWTDLSRSKSEDLLESINHNDAIESLNDFGLVAISEIVPWDQIPDAESEDAESPDATAIPSGSR